MKQLKFTDCVEIVGEACQPFPGYKKYVSTGAVDINHFCDNEIELVDYGGKPSRANLIAKSGDILFAKMIGTKKTLHLDEDAAKNIYSTGFCAVRARPTILTDRCLYYLLTSKAFLNQKDKNCSGATQKAITNAGLSKITIKVPSIGQQASIVQQLDRIVSIIALRQSELQKLDDLVKARFVEMFGDPRENPLGWKTGRLGDYMTTLTDFSANGSYELLDSHVIMYDEPNYAIMVRTTDLESGDLQNGVKYIDEAAYELLGKTKLYGGEMIMNKIGSAGKVYIMPHINIPASLGRNAFMFKFDERINTVFLYALLISEYGTAEIQQYVRGAVTKTITKDSTRSIRIIVPPIEKQKQFAAFVEQVDKSKVVESIYRMNILFNITLNGGNRYDS